MPSSVHLRLGLALLLVATACDCGDDGGGEDVPDGPTAATVEIVPGAVLLTSAGETRALRAVVRDGEGNERTETVTWSSSEPGTVSVDEAGVVTAIKGLGSARVTAQLGDLRSEPIYVTIAQPVPGALLVTDEQIVSGPTLVPSTDEPTFESPYEVVLRGVSPPAVDTVVIGTGAAVVGGRVVTTQPEGSDVRVRLVGLPPSGLFTAIEFRDTVVLGDGPFEVPAELAAQYDVERTGDRFVFTPKEGTVSQPLEPQGTRALPAPPPFKECSASAEFGSGLPFPLALGSSPAFDLSINGSLQREVTAQSTKLTVTATPTFKFSTELEIRSAFEAKVECKVTLLRRKVRVPGVLGILLGGDLEFGAGFEIGGKVTLLSAKVGGTAELKPTLTSTLDCPAEGSCSLTGDVSSTAGLKPTFTAPSLGQLQFEPSASLFGFMTAELGNADVEQLQFKAVEAKAGAELGASLTLEALQMTNPSEESGRSKYALAFKGSVGPGIKLGEFLEFLGLGTFVPATLRFELPLGESPSGTVTADEARYLPGEPVTLTVALEPESVLFPTGGLYNVDRVVILRQSGLLTTEALASQTATEGQTQFTFTFNSPGLLNDSELFAFVVTKVLPLDPPRLELGAAKCDCGYLQVAAGTFNNGAAGTTGTAFLARLRTPVGGDVVSEPVTLTVQGPSGWNGDAPATLTYPAGLLRQFFFLNAAPVSGQYTVEATVDGQALSAQATVDAASVLAPPANVTDDLLTTPGAVGSSWSAVTGAGSYLTRVVDVTLNRIKTPVAFTRSTQATLTGVPINGKNQNALQVFAFSNDMTPADPVIPEKFDLAFHRKFLTAGLTITPASATVGSGNTVALSATVTGLPGSVVWSASSGLITGTGNNVTWTAPSADGTVTLTATSDANSSFTARATYRVTGGGACSDAAAGARFAGQWKILAGGGFAQNCFTVPEFAAFNQGGGVIQIDGLSDSGSISVLTPSGLRSYSGTFKCTPDAFFSDSVNGNFSLGFEQTQDPDDTPVITGTMVLRLAGSPNVVPCTSSFSAEKQ